MLEIGHSSWVQHGGKHTGEEGTRGELSNSTCAQGDENRRRTWICLKPPSACWSLLPWTQTQTWRVQRAQGGGAEVVVGVLGDAQRVHGGSTNLSSVSVTGKLPELKRC